MMDQDKISELTKHYHSITPEDVVGVCIGKKIVNGEMTDEDAVVFTVKKKKPLDEIPEDEILPSEIEFEGIKFNTDVEEAELVFLGLEACPSDFYTWRTTPPGNRNKIRPISGGTSVTNYTNMSNSSGTLGFLAVDTDTNSLVGVSNNHVLVKNAFLASERYISGVHTTVYENFVTQPNEFGNQGLQNSIGLVKRYVPLSGTPKYNTVDAALTTINESDIDYSTSYRQYGITGWTQPLEFASTAEIDSIVINKNNLYSSGRTTGPKGEGQTKLFAQSLSHTGSILYNNQGSNQAVYFSNSIKFIASAATTISSTGCTDPIVKGDSGSALIADFSGTRKIVGIVFAGAMLSGSTIYGLANRIDKVAEQLSISAWTGNSVYFSSTGSTELHRVNGLSSDINLQLSGKTFWQAGTS